MKRWLCVLLCLGGLLCLPSCGRAANLSGEAPDALVAPDSPAAPDSLAAPDFPGLGEDETPAVLLLRIVDGAEEGNLLLAELDGGTGVYRLPVTADTAVYLDGEPADASVLEDGMPVEVAFNGAVSESFPSQLGEVYSVTAWSRGQGRNGAGTMYDLCGLYLQVLDDLWKKDPALNEGISVAGLDLSQAPGQLTEAEKSALAWRFGEMHGVEVVEGTVEELAEQGYLSASAISTPAPEEGQNFDKVWYQWPEGCLFSIRPNSGHEEETYSLPVLFFDAEKWCGPLAAYYFYDCSAMWGQVGSWGSYQIGSEMIS